MKQSKNGSRDKIGPHWWSYDLGKDPPRPTPDPSPATPPHGPNGPEAGLGGVGFLALWH